MRGNGIGGICYLLATALLAATSPASITVAQAQQASQQLFEFNIPSKPVPQAVNDIGRITGLSVVFKENRPLSINGQPVRGSLTPDQALSTLLAGTGLTYRFSNASTVQILDPRTANAGGAVAANGTLLLETIEVQGQVETARGPVTGIVATRSASASKTDTPLIETPQAVNVVTRDQMNAQNANTVAEALRYTPGIQADPNGYDVRYDWLYVRGFDTFGTVWMDGLTLPGDYLSYATPSINPFALERVEVVKGPASVLYGRAIPGGMVNQVSKRPQAEAHGEVGVQSNTNGGIQGSIDATGPLTEDGDWLYRFVGLAKNLHTQIDNERDRQIMAAPSLTWNPNDNTSLTLYGFYQKDKPIFSPRFYPAYGTLLKNPGGQVPRDLYLGDPEAEDFNRTYIAGGYEFSHSFNETWTFNQNLRYAQSEQDMFLVRVSPFGPWQPDGHSLNRISAISDDSVRNLNVDTNMESKFETGDLEHTALFGVDYLHANNSYNFANSDRTMTIPPLDIHNPIYGLPIQRPPAFTRSNYQTQSQVGLYAQDQVRWGAWLGTFGLRYDMSEIETTNRLIAGRPTVSTTDDKLTGRVGLTYLFDNGWAPYASYSTSFIPTTGTDRQGQAFEAQTGEQYEIGVKYEPVGSRGMFGLSYFNLTLENGLTPDPVDTMYSVQTGKQRIQGIEFEGKYELTRELEVLGSYAYSHSRVLSSNVAVAVDREMLRVPEHQASVWLNYSPEYVPGLALSGGARYTSSYQTDASYLADLRIPSRILVDIGMEYDFGGLDKKFEGTKLKVNVSNLFDEEYVSHCLNLGGTCNYGAGRAITAGLKKTW